MVMATLMLDDEKLLEEDEEDEEEGFIQGRIRSTFSLGGARGGELTLSRFILAGLY